MRRNVHATGRATMDNPILSAKVCRGRIARERDDDTQAVCPLFHQAERLSHPRFKPPKP